jgi:predicted nucleic acid-binding protein
MDYLLDTNIWLHYIRQTAKYQKILNAIFGDENRQFMSIATVGELQSLAMRNKWGKNKLIELKIVIEEVQVLPISRMDLAEIYAEMDTFSQGSHPTYALPTGMSARNMGKNDLWIAATARLLDLTLVTTDKDFEHLKDIFFPLILIEV